MPKSHSEPESMQVKPDPKLEKRSRRQFSTDYKLSLVSKIRGLVLEQVTSPAHDIGRFQCI